CLNRFRRPTFSARTPIRSTLKSFSREHQPASVTAANGGQSGLSASVARTAALDPTRTLAARICCDAQTRHFLQRCGRVESSDLHDPRLRDLCSEIVSGRLVSTRLPHLALKHRSARGFLLLPPPALLANTAIACLAAVVGVRSSCWPKASVHIHGVPL